MRDIDRVCFYAVIIQNALFNIVSTSYIVKEEVSVNLASVLQLKYNVRRGL
jgi:hypothetical protein